MRARQETVAPKISPAQLRYLLNRIHRCMVLEFKMEQMTHRAHGQAVDPHAGHTMSEAHGSHDRHAGHSVAMFRDKFWLSFALTIPVGLLVARSPTLAWLHSAFLPRLEIYPRNPRNGRLRLWRASFHPWGTGRTCRSQARHDDAHQPGDHRRLWHVARCDIRPLRDRSLVGTRFADHDHGPRPLAGNAGHFPGSWRTQCTCGAAPGHRRARNRR